VDNSKEYINIAKILKSHGIKGYCKIYLLTDFPERFSDLEKVIVRNENNFFEFTLEDFRFTTSHNLIKFKEISTPEEINKYRGYFISVTKDNRFSLPNNNYYIDDLLNINVYYESGDYVGKVINVYSSGQYVLEIKKTNNKTYLVPFVNDLVPVVDLENNKIVVKEIPGLLNSDYENA
jgi:16S rRNA processing protein RimM